MKSFMQRAMLPALGLMLLFAPVAFGQETEPVVFTLTNGTDYVITEFYATAPSSGNWEEDILGVDVLAPGESVEITIDDSREDCQYDFLAVFEDDTELEHESVAVCDGEEYVYE